MVGSSGSPPTYDCHWEHQQQQQQQQHTRNYYHHHRDEIQALVQAHYRTIATALCTQMSTTPHGRHNNHDLVVLDLEFATTTTTTTTSGAQQEQEVAFGIASVEDYDRHVAWRLRQCSPQKLKTVVRRDGQVEVYALEFGGGACHHAAKDDNDNAVVPALVEPPPLENVAAIPDDTTTTTTTTSTNAMVVPDSHQSPQLANSGDDLVMYRPLFPNGALWLSLFVAVLAVWWCCQIVEPNAFFFLEYLSTSSDVFWNTFHGSKCSSSSSSTYYHHHHHSCGIVVEKAGT